MKIICTSELNLNQDMQIIDIGAVYKIELKPEDAVEVFNFYNSTISIILAKNLIENVHCLIIDEACRFQILAIDKPEVIDKLNKDNGVML
jgi:hypothetical protein